MNSSFKDFSNFRNYLSCSNVQNIEYEFRCKYVDTTSECQQREYFFNYIHILYCVLKPETDAELYFSLFLFMSMIAIMFVMLGTTADQFFCPSLEMLSKILGLSEHLAGVTLLAFGNGSPDLFTSIASIGDPATTMYSNMLSSSIFVSSLVSGIICTIRPFHISGSSFLRDISFFILGTLFIDYVMETNNTVSFEEALCVITLYVWYLVTIVADQYLLKRRVRKMKSLLLKGSMSVADFKNLTSLQQEANIDIVARSSRSSADIEAKRHSFYGNDAGANCNIFEQVWEAINPVDLEAWRDGGFFKKIIICIRAPINLFLSMLIPKVDYELERHGWTKLLNCIQVFVLPFTIMFTIFEDEFAMTVSSCSLIVTVPLSIVIFKTTRSDRPPRFHVFFACLSALGSMFVIYSVASEAVEILYVLGLVMNFSNSFLGCTLLAWGNGIGDLISNTTLALHGYQKMAFAACFGGPFFNTVLSFSFVLLIKTLTVNGPVRVSFINRFLAAMGSWVQRFNIDCDRLSFSEPDLPAAFKHLDRFNIKHLHEYIAVDELKFYRRRKPPDYLTKSHICLSDLKNDSELPFSPLKTEYRRSYLDLQLPLKTLPLRRATSLRLEGLMPFNRSEHQDRYLWFTPEDYKSSRSYPMKKPESLRLAGGFDMEPEYRSSYIMHPMLDRTTKILPREMFSLHSPKKTTKIETKSSSDIELIQKVHEDKVQREKASDLLQECHLQRRAFTDENAFTVSPSEYQRQFVPQLSEKAHSIPQMDHIKMQGNFHTIPEYQDSFKMYANYAKPMPIIKNDNLRMSGSEMPANSSDETKNMPEYREKFHDLPKDMVKEKSLKTEDHLRPNREFSKDVPEYYESFRDPQVKQLPEKGKCREPYLHLKGKLEFNPEYRQTYLNFPRSRPIVPKPTSTFRLPTSNTTTTNSSRRRSSVSPRKYEDGLNTTPSIIEPETDLTVTPEYRRACYNYQIRERSPKQKAVVETPLPKDHKKFNRKSVSPQYQKNITAFNRQRRSILAESPQSSSPGLENIGQKYKQQKTPKFGRRAGGAVLKNAENCRANTSIIEGNPKYRLSQRKDAFNSENIHDSFVVLENKPFNRSHWMK